MRTSILIPVLADNLEAEQTVKSFRETSPEKDVEIILVDDCSPQPLRLPSRYNTKIIRNNRRMGCAASRQLAAERATGDVLLIIDSHMRAEKCWFENMVSEVEASPNTIFNGTTLGLNSGQMDITKFQSTQTGPGVYNGARLQIYEPSEPPQYQILEGKWKPSAHRSEISCLMGAIYIIPRDIFFAIGGLRGLTMWGGDEQMLSIKALLSGYSIKQLWNVRLGHKFKLKGENSPYTTNDSFNIYNKLWCIMTLFDKDVSDFLISKFPRNNNFNAAHSLIMTRKELVKKERAFNKSIFLNDIDFICSRFPDVKHPLK